MLSVAVPLTLTSAILAALLLPSPSVAQESCSWDEVASKAIIDLTASLQPSTVAWESNDGIGSFRTLIMSQDQGDAATVSEIGPLNAHTATHIDSPCHWIAEECHKGLGIESLSLHALIGPALVVEVDPDVNITADVLSGLAIPPGTERLVFKTDNTARGLMQQTAFDSSYTAMTADGASWLVDNRPSVQLVGIDYTSIAVYDDLPGAHLVLLPKNVVIVEGLVLDQLAAGMHMLTCLPLKLQGFDGSPARCVATAR